MKLGITAMVGLALCSVTLAHPGALSCGDTQMNLKGTIMGMTVAPPASADSVKISLSPATYTPGKPVTVKASGWPKGAYIALGVSGPGGGESLCHRRVRARVLFDAHRRPQQPDVPVARVVAAHSSVGEGQQRHIFSVCGVQGVCYLRFADLPYDAHCTGCAADDSVRDLDSACGGQRRGDFQAPLVGRPRSSQKVRQHCSEEYGGN